MLSPGKVHVQVGSVSQVPELPSGCVQSVKAWGTIKSSMFSIPGPSVDDRSTTTRDTMSESLDHKRDFEDTGSAPSVVDASDLPRNSVRPPIDYSSPAAFTSSSWARWKSLWTRRFTLSLLAGQVVSLCITVTNVTTTELISRNWSLPTTQTWFLCVFWFLWWSVTPIFVFAGTVRYFSFTRRIRYINVSMSVLFLVDVDDRWILKMVWRVGVRWYIGMGGNVRDIIIIPIGKEILTPYRFHPRSLWCGG